MGSNFQYLLQEKQIPCVCNTCQSIRDCHTYTVQQPIFACNSKNCIYGNKYEYTLIASFRSTLSHMFWFYLAIFKQNTFTSEIIRRCKYVIIIKYTA